MFRILTGVTHVALMGLCSGMFVALSTLPGHAYADKAEARQLLKQGLAAVKAGKSPADLKRALGLFKRSFKQDPTALAECNIGIAYSDLNQLSRAHLFLGNCISRLGAIKPRRLALMRKWQARVEKRLRAAGFVAIEVRSKPAGAVVSVDSFAADETFRAPRLIWLSPAAHTFTANLAGHDRANKRLDVTAAGAQNPVVIELSKTPVPVVDPGKTKPIVTPTQKQKPIRKIKPVEGPRIPPTVRYAPRSKWAPILLGAGALTLAGGGLLHVIAAGKRSDLPNDGPERALAVSTFKKYRIGVVSLYAVSAIATTLSVYLYKRKRSIRSERSVDVAFVPLDGNVGAVVSVRGPL